MVFNYRSSSFSSSGLSEEPAVVQSVLSEECLSLRSSLLRLKGRCYSGEDWFLVCPFISDCNADDPDLLELGDWLSRKRVALGVARGLAHLQGKVRSRIQSLLLIHAGKEFVAIPGAFGSFTEYPQLHEKDGVRGYGVMLLQLITGEEPSFLLELVRLDGMNPKCCAAMITLRSPPNYVKEEAEQLSQLAFRCVFEYPDRVAGMSEVVKTIEQEVCSADLLMSSPSADLLLSTQECSADMLTSSPDPSDGQKSKSGSGSTPYYSLLLCRFLSRD